MHVIQHPDWVNSIAFSPDGSCLASGSDSIVRIWNTATGELEDELEGHTSYVKSVAFSHNGQFIVSGSWDKTVWIWNTATSETTYMLMGHTNQVRSVAMSRDDKFVVSGSALQEAPALTGSTLDTCSFSTKTASPECRRTEKECLEAMTVWDSCYVKGLLYLYLLE